MLKFCVVLIFFLITTSSLYSKEIGIAWVGKSHMQDRLLEGLLSELNIYKNKFNIELQKELNTVEELRQLTYKWNKEKDAMILLRSSAAKMLVNTKTSIPTFIGGTNHPVVLGTVKSFLAPAGNITGVTYYINKKTTLRMISLFVPNMKSILFIGELGHPSTPIEQKETLQLSKTIFHIKYSEIVSDDLDFILEKIKEKKDNVSAIVLGNQALIMDNAGVISDVSGNTPVFSYSKVSVAHGALAGYSADDRKLGKELGKTVYSVLYENKKIYEVPIKVDTAPLFYVNKNTLNKLQIKIPERLKDKVIYIQE